MCIHTFVKICWSEHTLCASLYANFYLNYKLHFCTSMPVHPSIVNFVILKPTQPHFLLLCQVAPCLTLPTEGDRGGLGVWRKKKEIFLASFCSLPVSCLCVVLVHHSSHIFTPIAEYPAHKSSRIQCAVFQPLQNLPHQHYQETPAPEFWVPGQQDHSFMIRDTETS